MSHRDGGFFKFLYRKRMAIAIATGCLGTGMLSVIFLPFWVWIFFVGIGLIFYSIRTWKL